MSSAFYASESELESLFKRYDDIWDKNKGEFKRICVADWKPVHKGLAFYMLRSFDKNNRNHTMTLVITSRYLCEAINAALLDTESTVALLQSEINPHVLYHYLDEFRDFEFKLGTPVPQALEDPQLSRTHLAALIYLLDNEYEYDRVSSRELLAMHPPYISFDQLWIIFKPKTLILTKGKHPRLYRCKSILKSSRPHIELSCEYIGSNGKKAGFSPSTLNIYYFGGVKKVTELSCFPFEFYTPRAPMENFLEERGRKYIRICQKGRQVVCRAGADQDSPEGDGRLIIDAERYAAEGPNFSSGLIGDLDAMHYQLCDSSLVGFSAKELEWEDYDDIYVDDITDIIWKEEMLDNVVLESTTKTMIKGLVSHHDPANAKRLQDIIPGKGTGLVMLFNGPPGVGKTLTAEAVAEATHRLIYRITSNDLSSDPGELEYKLGEIFRRGAQFDIILLLDDADVFLEQRTSFNMRRNSLVSIFLRELKYYTGILILTANRVESLDRELESRIHFNLRFPELNKSSRMQLWQFLTDKLNDITFSKLLQLAEFKLDGRMIKNAVSYGLALAKIQNQSLSFTHISDGLRFIDPSLTIEPSTKPNDANTPASPMDPAWTPGQASDLGGNMESPREFIHPETVLGRQGGSVEQEGKQTHLAKV